MVVSRSTESILLSSDDPALLGVQCIKAGDDLTSINGCTEIVGSTSLQAVDLEQVRVAGFSVTLSGNSALHAVEAASLAKDHLDLVLEGNMALERVDFPGLADGEWPFLPAGHWGRWGPGAEVPGIPGVVKPGQLLLGIQHAFAATQHSKP